MQLPRTRRAVANVAGAALAACGFALFASFFVMEVYWVRHSPDRLMPASGNLYAHNEHGSITYQTAFEATSRWLLLTISPISLVLGICLMPMKSVVLKSSRFGLKIKGDPDDPERVRLVGSLIGVGLALLVFLFLGPVFARWLNAHGIVLNPG